MLQLCLISATLLLPHGCKQVYAASLCIEGVKSFLYGCSCVPQSQTKAKKQIPDDVVVTIAVAVVLATCRFHFKVPKKMFYCR